MTEARLKEIIERAYNDWHNEGNPDEKIKAGTFGWIAAAIVREFCLREHNRTPAGFCAVCEYPRPQGVNHEK